MALSIFDAQLLEKILKERYAEKESFNKNDIYNILNEMTKVEQYYPTGKKVGGEKYKVFKWFVRYLFYRACSNLDNMILIESSKGSGKSSMAILLAREWCSLLGWNFSTKKHMAYTNAQVMERIDNLPIFSPCILDEAVNFMSAAEWAKVENRMLRRKLAQVRTKHLFFILCWPMKINKVERTYLDSFVNYWIHIIKRGTGAIFIPDQNPYSDPWKLKEFIKLGAINEFSSPETVVKRLKKHSNYWQLITVPKPSEKFYKKYLTVRESNIYNTENSLVNTSRQDIIRAVIIKLFESFMVRESSMSMKRLIPYIKKEYNVDLKEAEINSILSDCGMLLEKITKEKVDINLFASETDWSNTHKQTYDDEEDENSV